VPPAPRLRLRAVAARLHQGGPRFVPRGGARLPLYAVAPNCTASCACGRAADGDGGRLTYYAHPGEALTRDVGREGPNHGKAINRSQCGRPREVADEGRRAGGPQRPATPWAYDPERPGLRCDRSGQCKRRAAPAGRSRRSASTFVISETNGLNLGEAPDRGGGPPFRNRRAARDGSLPLGADAAGTRPPDGYGYAEALPDLPRRVAPVGRVKLRKPRQPPRAPLTMRRLASAGIRDAVTAAGYPRRSIVRTDRAAAPDDGDPCGRADGERGLPPSAARLLPPDAFEMAPVHAAGPPPSLGVDYWGILPAGAGSATTSGPLPWRWPPSSPRQQVIRPPSMDLWHPMCRAERRGQGRALPALLGPPDGTRGPGSTPARPLPAWACGATRAGQAAGP